MGLLIQTCDFQTKQDRCLLNLLSKDRALSSETSAGILKQNDGKTNVSSSEIFRIGFSLMVLI